MGYKGTYEGEMIYGWNSRVNIRREMRYKGAYKGGWVTSVHMKEGTQELI